MKNNIYKNIIVIFIAIFTFSACEDEGIESIFNRTDGGIGAVIIDEAGAPVADAKVTLYNFTTENRIAVEYTNEQGIVDFGRFEAGEYNLVVELTHNDDWFSFGEEVHVISGVDTRHEINLAEHTSDAVVRIRNSATGELVSFDLPIKVGFIPMTEENANMQNEEEFISKVTMSYDAENILTISDLPVAQYLIILYSDGNILESNYLSLDSYETSYMDFYVDELRFLLESKSSWNLTSVDADTAPNENLIPISSISFEGDIMTVTYENNEVDEARFGYYSDEYFDWYNLNPDDYNFYFDESGYVINDNGSITFNFVYWETYDYNLGQYFSSSNVSLTFN